MDNNPKVMASDARKSDWFAGDVDCDGEPLTTITTHEYNRLVNDCEKFRDQVRDTCARAEKAEGNLERCRRVAESTLSGVGRFKPVAALAEIENIARLNPPSASHSQGGE